jgi:hypothetical protein
MPTYEYECRYCGDICTYSNDKELWSWQEFCSRVCFLERWIDVNEHNQAFREMMKEKRKRRCQLTSTSVTTVAHQKTITEP